MNTLFADFVALSISAVALLFSAFTWYRSHKATLKQARATIYSSIMGRLFEINQLEIEKPGLFESLYEDFNPAVLEKGREGLSHYLFMLFNIYEEAFTQHQKFGLFDNNEMEQWRNRLRNDFFQRKFLQGYWRHDQELFSNERSEAFSAFVHSVLKEAEEIQARNTSQEPTPS